MINTVRRRKGHWWNRECTVSRDKLKFWFYIWRSSDRPRSGVLYDCYKYTKQNFRKLYRMAVNKKTKTDLSNCDKMFCGGNSRTMWNNNNEKCRSVNRISPNVFQINHL